MIQIYSFLDFREDLLGKSFIAETGSLLAQALEKRGVRSAQLRFADSPLRTETVVDWTQEGRGRSSARVLVGEVIAANKRDEDAFAPTHRLIVFPIQVTRIQANSRFDVRWILVDARTGNSVWSTTSFTNRMNWVSGNDFAASRANEFVEGLIAEMEKSKVFGKATPN